MWGEQISPQTIDSRIWPRTAAIAERFWSDATIRNVNDMYRRLRVMSLRLDALGLQQISGPERSQRRLAGEVYSPQFSVLASVLEPNGSKERYPLDGLVDAVVPDPASKHNFALAVQELLVDTPKYERRRADLEKIFRSWQHTAPLLKLFMQQSPHLAEYASQAQQLAELGDIGTEALYYLHASTDVPAGWQKAKLAEIAAIEQQKLGTLYHARSTEATSSRHGRNWRSFCFPHTSA